ncbi:MAG: hypothetical protein QXW35_00695 [Candidatus Aenigmatarchaeota archaeon]
MTISNKNALDIILNNIDRTHIYRDNMKVILNMEIENVDDDIKRKRRGNTYYFNPTDFDVVFLEIELNESVDHIKDNKELIYYLFDDCTEWKRWKMSIKRKQ